MDMLDIIFSQIEKRTKSKTIIRKHISNIKNEFIKEGITDDVMNGMTENDIIKLINIMRKSVNMADVKTEANKLLIELTFAQWVFYKLNANYDHNIANIYETYFYTCEELYSDIKDYMEIVPPGKYIYEHNYSDSYKTASDNIDIYCDSLKIAIKSTYKIFEQGLAKLAPGMPIFMVYHNDVIGKEDAWRQKIGEWAISRRVYRLHVTHSMIKADIIRYLATMPELNNIFNPEQHDMSNLTHKLDKYLADAQRLIASAANGSFPY